MREAVSSGWADAGEGRPGQSTGAKGSPSPRPRSWTLNSPCPAGLREPQYEYHWVILPGDPQIKGSVGPGSWQRALESQTVPIRSRWSPSEPHLPHWLGDTGQALWGPRAARGASFSQDFYKSQDGWNRPEGWGGAGGGGRRGMKAQARGHQALLLPSQ